jgi:serine O-acetyltransferase
MFENIIEDAKQLTDGRPLTARVLLRGLLSQGFQAIMVYRFFRWLKVKKIPSQPYRFMVERFIEITAGISIPASCEIGKGFRIHHFGGIMFHPTVKIGDYCTIYHDVTIGDRGGYGNAATIGNYVMIGAGAKIIGQIAIGDNCKIGANCVVEKSIPANCIVYGNPLIIKSQDFDYYSKNANHADLV